MAFRFCACLAAGLSASCLLAVSLDGLEGPAPLVADGGDDAASADGGGDALADRTSPDGPAEAGASLFAEGFERDDLLGPWDEINTDPPSLASITNDSAHGGTRALRVALAPADGAGATHQKVITSKVDRVRYSFWLRFQAAPNRNANLPGFVLVDPVGVAIFAVSRPNGSIAIAVQKQPSFFFESGEVAAPVGRWFSVAIEHDATRSTYSATIDGVQRVLPRGVGVATVPESIILRSGTTYATSGPSFTYFVDDITLEALP